KDTSGYTYADIIVAVFSLREMRFEHITYIGGHGVDVAGSAIYDADRDVVRILGTSGSVEFPFLAPKASDMSFRGVLLDFDVRRGAPISAIPVVDFRSTYMGKIIKTTTGRMLVSGRLAYDITIDVLPIRPKGFKTALTGLRDVFIGELHDTPVHVERIAEAVDGALRVLTNPARGEIRFVVEGASPETVTALLYDLLGRRVAEAPLLHNGRSAHGRMQVRGLAPGMYILAAPGPDGVRTAKVVVMNR
ncbi:MAG: T9SS type A sorting domain-containing protein, partial [Bacteroidetes bacterium]|nr:T9SS type A sorting domain-containing protein [Bacteroidota bacterium]